MTLAQFGAELTKALLPTVTAFLVTLIGVVFARLTIQIRTHFGQQAAAKSAAYLGLLQDVADHTVIATQQAVVDRLKASGEWNADTAKYVKHDAVQAAMGALGDLGAKIEAQLLLDVPQFLGLLMESSLAHFKAAGQFAPAPVVTPVPVEAPAPAPLDIPAILAPVPSNEIPMPQAADAVARVAATIQS